MTVCYKLYIIIIIIIICVHDIHSPDVLVGLEQTLYEVDEGANSVTVCAVVLNPPDTEPLPTSFTLVANTLGATASMMLTIVTVYVISHLFIFHSNGIRFYRVQ